jgi:hypothetical protein
MANIPLSEFIDTNRTELIRRCQLKVIERSGPEPLHRNIKNGVPLFLDQLVQELGDGPSNTKEIRAGAIKHGKELLVDGFTIGQVVHGYGDVCQSVTDLAVELAAPISADDFRTLNRCLDDAIAGAVTEFSRGEDLTRDGESHELRILLSSAIAAFEMLQTGSVGFAGTTATLVHSNLVKVLAGMDRAVLEPVSARAKGPQ